MKVKALFLCAMCFSQLALAHQPVMDMAPRWENGYGIQTRVERFDNQTTNWLEGVYTFEPSKRVTFKLPYIENDGLGDLIIGVPLKRYTNKKTATSNWGITPSVQFPTGEDGEWDVGLSLSYSSESKTLYQLYDLYAWKDRIGVDINLGLHPYHNNDNNSGIYTMWDVSLLSSDDGDRIQSGPILVYYWQNIMFRAEYKALVHERDSNIKQTGGDEYTSIGVGMTF